MIDAFLMSKTNELKNLESEEDIQLWYYNNKTEVKRLRAALACFEFETDRNGRVQFRQIIWHCVNDVFTKPICKNKRCNNYVKWNGTTHRYQQFCSNTCNHQHGELNTKRKKTLKDRYGVENLFFNVEQIKKARIKKLGVPHAMQNKKVQQRTREKMRQKYGVDHPWKDPKIRAKCVQTREYCFISEDVKKLLDNKEWLELQLNTLHKTQQQIADELQIAQSTVGLYANEHGIECKQKSKIELQIASFVGEHYCGDILINDRTILPQSRELDIVLPDIKLAIEIDGVFWHGELNGKDKKYHYNKIHQCKKAGYTLLHIFDTEWKLSKQIVKSRLLSKLGKNQKIYARKCSIVSLTTTEERDFFNTNHIQQFIGSSYCYALKHEETIIAAMSLGKSRFNNYQFELLRYCSANGVNVIGGASKLFCYFIKQQKPNNVVSFANLRWGVGNLYTHLGFSFVGTTPPNYYYFERNSVGQSHKIFHRITFQKHKLKCKLKTFNPTLTEWENMINNGYDRIWDCGNSKWIWEAK